MIYYIFNNWEWKKVSTDFIKNNIEKDIQPNN